MAIEKKPKTSPDSIVREIKRKTRASSLLRRREHYRPLPQRGNPSHQLLQMEQIIP